MSHGIEALSTLGSGASAAQRLAQTWWPPSRPMVAAAVVLVALIAYALLGGADFGGGVWDLLASGPRRDRQRSAIAHAIGPIWEANHVWLILVIVLLFTCFPAVYADLSVVLHIPLALMLIGIVLRGSAFTFRAYDPTGDQAGSRWGRIFAVASLLTPVLLGTIIGAIASGDAGRAVRADSDASFRATFIAPWLTPFAVAVGMFTLALFAFLAAVYLTVATSNDVDVQADFRRRALAAAGAVFVTAAATLAIASTAASRVGNALVLTPWGWALNTAAAGAAVTTIAALIRHRFRLARVAAAAQVSLIIGGWAIAQYPYLVPPVLTVDNAASPPATLDAALIALAAGAVVLLPALGYLFRVFTGANNTLQR